MDPGWIGVIGTLGGALLGSFSTYMITRLNKKSEEKRQLREIAIKAAIEKFNYEKESAYKEVAKGRSVILMPLDDTIIKMTKLMELTLDGDVSPDNIESKLAEIYELGEKIQQYRLKREDHLLR